MSRFAMLILTTLCVMMILTSCVNAADYPEPVLRAMARLAADFNVTPDRITVVSVQGVDWPDTSLGAPRPGHVYAQIITPGYKVVLEVQGKRYEYHTDMRERAVAVREGEPDGEPAPAPGPSVPTPPVARECREDLARRLNAPIGDVTVARVEAVEFPDASLGLPRPGEMYAQVITPGFIIRLMANNTAYLYTASEKACRYGGPLHALAASALYLEPVENDPNLNGNLVQVSLAGNGPTTLLREISDFHPQENGLLLAKRRTSRSGHDLLYVPRDGSQEIRLASALDFGDAVVNTEGTRWAAYVRPGLGQDWQVYWGALSADAEPLGQVDLPAGGQPGPLFWHMTNPVAAVPQGDGVVYYELLVGADQPRWRKAEGFYPPPTKEFMLNKSETLMVKVEQEGGRTVTRISRRWFTGDDKPVATIENFAPKELSITPDKRFLLLSCENAAFSVDLVTGEVLTTAEQVRGPVRLFLSPVQGWLWSRVTVEE